ncbi:MAG: hypothetical protein WC843_04040 [Candidatus Gracilibacteria bacterium]|jgi:translation initiation factor 2B subunit (eIF-2B alpha/beta/delta family)
MPSTQTKKLKKSSLALGKISALGADLIKDGMTIFTFCYSQTVLEIFKKAKTQKKDFQVICSETRPNLTGIIMAKELAKLNIPVTITVDVLALQNLRQSDLFLFGVDSLTSTKKIINKNGTTLMIKLAKMLQVPSFACTSLKKSANEKQAKMMLNKTRPSKEIWYKAPSKIMLRNPAYDLTELVDITGIICEKGILKTGN